jgi:hypothetical protein
VRPSAHNEFDPQQPRDEHGRWREEGAITASREAFARSSELVVQRSKGEATNSDQRVAAQLHHRAAAGNLDLARKHERLGNAKAARHFRALAEEHEESARYHETQIERAPVAPSRPGLRKASSARSLGGYRAAETRAEREGRATSDIEAMDPALLPLWNRTKRNFKGTPHERYERFLEYAEEHPDEVTESVHEASEAKLDALIREYNETPQVVANPARRIPMGRRNPAIEATRKQYEAYQNAHRDPAAWQTAKRELDEAAVEASGPYPRSATDDVRVRWPDGSDYIVSWRDIRAMAAKRRRNPMLGEDDKASAIEAAEFHVRHCKEALYRAEIRLEWARKGYAEPPGTEPEAVLVAEQLETRPDGTTIETELVEEMSNPGKPNKGRKVPTYKEAHWGKKPKGARTLDAPDPRQGPLSALGELVEVTYGTIKTGDTSMTNYTHTFTTTEGRPTLAYNRRGRLLILGGGYTMEKRGIVG